MFRISRMGRAIAEAETIEGAREVVGRQPPGTYDVDQIASGPASGAPQVRAWGRLVRHPDGRIEDDAWAGP